MLTRSRSFVLTTVATWFFAATAYALPVWFDGPDGYGISAAQAAGAEAAGFSILSVEQLQQATPLEIPAPDVLGYRIKSSPTRGNPTTAFSRWEVTNGGDSTLADTWLVFLTPLNYTPSKVGIDLQAGGDWAVISVLVAAGEGYDEYFYPAVRLGDLEPGEDAESFIMKHVLATKLKKNGAMRILPQYQVGLVSVQPVPEPASIALFCAGGVLVACALRGRRS